MNPLMDPVLGLWAMASSAVALYALVGSALRRPRSAVTTMACCVVLAVVGECRRLSLQHAAAETTITSSEETP